MIGILPPWRDPAFERCGVCLGSGNGEWDPRKSERSCPRCGGAGYLPKGLITGWNLKVKP